MTTKEALYNFCLRLGDNHLILGQRLAEWCSRGPILEEDLAMTNLSLDHFGQAEMLFDYAAEVENKNNDADDIAFKRSEREYFNCLITEQPNGDFDYTMLKQLLFSAFYKHLYEALSKSKDEVLAALAVKGLKEIKYHLRHSGEWVVRMGRGTEESSKRIKNALNEIWMFTDDLFEMNETDKILIKEGISFDLNELFPKWKSSVELVFAEASLVFPKHGNMIKGGINGMHTEHLGHLLCELQYLQRSYPTAKWKVS